VSETTYIRKGSTTNAQRTIKVEYENGRGKAARYFFVEQILHFGHDDGPLGEPYSGNDWSVVKKSAVGLGFACNKLSRQLWTLSRFSFRLSTSFLIVAV
jgi:hypothetical protein